MEEEEESMEALTKAVHRISRMVDELESRSSYLVATCEVCGMQGHTRNFCQFNTPYYPNQTSYWEGNFDYSTNHNSDQIPQYNPYPSTYNSGWENYPNFSYQNHSHPPQKSSLETALETFISEFSQNQQYYPQYEEIQVSPCLAQTPEITYPQPPQKSNLEILLEEFISTQEKKNEEFETSLSTNKRILSEMKAHTKLMEAQLAQMA